MSAGLGGGTGILLTRVEQLFLSKTLFNRFIFYDNLLQYPGFLSVVVYFTLTLPLLDLK